MRHPSRPFAIAAATLLLAACQAAQAPAPQTSERSYGTLRFHPCTLTNPVASNNVAAQCTRMAVAENPAAPNGRKIELNIAWLPITGEGGSDPDPVFFLAGGPGQAATQVASIVDMALRETRKRRDVFLIDQRGTGQSNPLSCLGPDGKDMPLADPARAPTAAELVDYARRCAQSLQGRADPRYYTTTQAIGDLDAVRAALGVDKVNLIGGSYGTRVAQQYARRYAPHVRSVVIDGVAPNDLVVGGEFANTFEDAIALQAEQCKADPACAKRFPTDTRTQLRAVVERLRQAPVEVDYRDPASGESRHDRVTADTVTSLAFSFSYAPQTASLLPLVLDEAANGRYGPLMSLARMMGRQLDGQMNRGMQWSVICAEDADRYRAPQTHDTLLGPEVAQMFFAPCPVWPTGTRPADFTAPFTSTLPVLLTSGQLDPVTPPRYAERVLKGLPNGRHLVVRGQGHGTMTLGCMPKLLGQFFETADAKHLDATCLDAMSGVPAFTSFNGWEP
ncbi:alpha/beta hydrolase [Xanthomonas sp. LMG 8992]|uniref:alpha/beta hydrolase n=1 Tax=unclassified Xanthomonas TaxID=2643310 RepID=UPI00065AB75E|nr:MULTISPECIES: alpha/beta fold hydrolase [unclassified Xanthomonas]KMM74905.1 cysteine protease [Xanthomonas sp. NCPPB 1128]MXV12985.1 alpha/beta hydrolase [Xanthomonas sp. LMG 8992]